MTWPLAARIREARLRIVAPDYGAQHTLHKRGMYGPRIGEHWAGELVLAALSRHDALAMEAWHASRQGRLQPFVVPAGAGFMTHPAFGVGFVIGIAQLGMNYLDVAISGGQTLPAGTLLSIGSATADAFQTVEVLTELTTTGSTQTVAIAPRIRHSFPDLTPIALHANATFRLRLRDDDAGFGQYGVGRGAVWTLQVVEAIADSA